ncbi:MAG: HNH endonuclease [Actinomycetota bacterium]|nr:HNH endonuclease [Actinomycetota bacterium]
MTDASWHAEVYGKWLGSGTRRRKTPGARHGRLILEEQQHRCAYCGIEFGDYTFRRGRPIQLRITWDHVIPYVYSEDSSDSNFVAACQVCNAIKNARMFESVNDAAAVIQRERWSRGYRDWQETA